MGTFYIVGTPIGNLGDITLRALETLKNVDCIACEDTRHSMGLLNYYDIKKPLIACHKFNEKQSVEKLSHLLNEDKNIALISDAGMPGISDPGAIVVDALRRLGHKIEVVPGPSAVVSAITLSGIVHPIFTFIGFLPSKNKDRKSLIEQFKNINTSLVIYSSPYDVDKDCKFLYTVLGDRGLYVVKELTKIHESSTYTSLEKVNLEDAKGEYVLIVEPPKQEELIAKPEGSIEEQVKQLMNEGINKKEAIKQVAKVNGLSKNDVYQQVMDLD